MIDLKIFTENIEPTALEQIYTLAKHPSFEGCKIRIMPDVHAGAGCVIGFTADLGDKVIPNIVGVDIGCGMLCIELKEKDIDLAKLDEVIRKYVPSGKSTHSSTKREFAKLNELRCLNKLKGLERIKNSIGTLGGGNHFIEVDEDSNGTKFLIIHSGSRNLGKQVAEYYQNLAIETLQNKKELNVLKSGLMKEYHANGKVKDIDKDIKKLEQMFCENLPKVPKQLSYLIGKQREDYLHDMKICQEYATLNREVMANIILDKMNLHKSYQFETIHNYIENETNMVRKGAVSSKDGEVLLIPINMRDGCIIGIGKGNDEWNQSAPHGAGRIMSRSKAKDSVDLEDYIKSMDGIYTTSVSKHTIDEAPMVYKPMEEILNNIKDTVEIDRIIKPIYNFKACE